MIILLLDASSITVGSVYRNNNDDQLFGVGALAHRGLLPRLGSCAGEPLAFPALHLLPVRAVQVNGAD